MIKIKQRKINSFLLSSIIIIGVFLLGHVAFAGDFWADTVIGGLISVLIRILGVILTFLIGVLVEVAQWSLFIKSDAVTNGWIIVRDICNMFFVIILLIIAFGTILRLENYSFKKWLPKLMLMAILINFSKTICGVMIDVAQLVMLTFVNAFKGIAGGNFIEILGITDIVKMASESEETGFGTIVGAYLLGLIYMIISLVVITAMLAMLVMRIVMIWVYVVLSPLAYLLAAFPGGQSYAKKWWTQFIQNLIVGPVLAFFIWLSFAALQNQIYTPANNQDFLGSEASTPAVLIKFVIAIGMLIAGLKIAKEIGGEAGNMAGKGMDAINKGQSKVFGGGGKLMSGLARGAGTLAKQPFSYGADKIQEAGIVDLKLGRAWKTMQKKREDNINKRYVRGKVAAQQRMQEGGRTAGIFAMTANADDAWEQMTSGKSIIKRIRGGESMTKKRKKLEPALTEARDNFEDTKFKLEYLQSSPAGQKEIKKETEAKINLKEALIDQEKKKPEQLQDKKLLTSLSSERKELEGQNLWTTVVDATDKHQQEKQAMSLKGIYSDQEKDFNNKRKEFSKHVPEYHFEARAADQALVNEEMGKIKDISDPTELLTILEDAISSRNKALSKAAMLKMTKDYNDNEFLQPLAGRTDHVGLKKLMNDLSDKGSDHYGGFGKQEAFALGGQIAEMNKMTNHWAATAAFTMENGQWRETTDEEHFNIRNIETGKLQQQKLSRDSNRLAYGFHDKTGKFHVDLGGIMLMNKFDSESGHNNMRTMNESAAKRILETIMSNPTLKKRYENPSGTLNSSLIDELKKRLGEVADITFEEELHNAVQAIS